MAKVRAVNISRERSSNKIPQPRVLLQAGFGIEGDAHAGPGPREVSLLAWEKIEQVRAQGIPAGPGDFAENITTQGIDMSTVNVGTMLRVGEALLEVSGIGKPEWKPGDYSFKGRALLAEEGVFARVIQGGLVKSGDAVIIEEKKR
jgi:molybdopterin adenylyltransferase